MTTHRTPLRSLLLLVAAVALLPVLSRAGSSTGVAPSQSGATMDPLADSYAREAKGDAKGAAAAMKIAADVTPQSYFARLRLAYLLLHSKDASAAVESYRIAATLAPAAVEPLLGEQQALVSLARFDEAEKTGLAIVERDPKSYLGLSRLAWTQYSLKKYAAALQTYQSVLDLYPADAEMRAGIGYSLLALGKKTDAAAAFSAVLATMPGHKGATDGLALCK